MTLIEFLGLFFNPTECRSEIAAKKESGWDENEKQFFSK